MRLLLLLLLNVLSVTFCSTDKPEEEMIRCSNPDCPVGSWYHVSCVEVTVVPDDDWWCCDECRDTRRSLFCLCKRVQSGPVVKCANDNCPYGSDFHLKCVNLGQHPGNVLCRRYNTIQYDSEYLTCSIKLTGSQRIVYH